jgi:hypothetical protein
VKSRLLPAARSSPSKEIDELFVCSGSYETRLSLCSRNRDRHVVKDAKIVGDRSRENCFRV